MSKYVGSWWIKDGIDGRRLEAEGFVDARWSLRVRLDPEPR